MKTKDMESLTGAYPYTPMNLCLPLAEAVYALGGGRSGVSKALLASHLKENEKGQSLNFKITSAKCFKMISGRSEFVLTDVSNRYFSPVHEGEKPRALLEFFESPPAFRSLIERFDGSRLPGIEMLGNILHREARVSLSWKQRVAGFFIRSAQMVGVMEDGYLRFKAARQGELAPAVFSGEDPAMEKPSEKPTGNTSTFGQRASASQLQIASDSNVWTFRHENKTIRVETPADLTAELWKKLNGYIQLLNPKENNS